MFDKGYHFLTPRNYIGGAGGRVGLKGGGADWINTHEPGPMGNPAVMEKIENMREWKIANPDVEDVAEYFTLATTNEVINETFNCTRGNGRKIIEAAEIIKSKLGTGEITPTPHDPFYPSRDTLNSDKAKTMLNFNPSVDIEEGIPKYINWFLGQPFYFENLDINKQFPLGMKI